jgi:hypothetical protein
MDIKKHDEMILDAYVNRCIDNIIKHGLIKGVIDIKSFADFALPLDFDDDRLVEGIGQAIAMTSENLSDEEKNALSRECSYYKFLKEDSKKTCCTKRLETLEECSDDLLELVVNRIRKRLKQESNE